MTIGVLKPVTYTEGDPAQAVGGSLSFGGGTSYGGGSITFNLNGSTSTDQFQLASAANSNAAGAISFDSNGFVFLGNGTSRDVIGTVDAIENGLNGNPLTINFTGPISNPSFENGLTGWTLGDQRVVLGTTVINGHLAPNDLTDPPNTVGDADGAAMTFSHELSADEHTSGSNSLRLYNSGNTNTGFDVVHGPYAYSNTFHSSAGDVLQFDWKAAGGSDAYDAFGYLMNADTGAYEVVLNQTGADASGVTNWTTASVAVPTDGNWFFVFVAGTYDASGGKAVGGSLFVDNFKIVNALVTDAVVQTIANQVTYASTTDAALTPRTLTVDVTDGSGNTQSASASLIVVNVNDAPTGGLVVAGTAKQGEVLTAPNDIADLDGVNPSAIGHQWQRQDVNGDWVNINGVTGTTYTLTESDVDHKVRVVSSYTDAGGTAEQVISTPTASVENVNDVPSGGLLVAGTTSQGAVLTAPNDIADLDGVSSSTIEHQWQRQDANGDWVNINGATGMAYTLTEGDVDRKVRVVSSYTDGHGKAEQVFSNPTAAVVNVNDAPVGLVAVTGVAAQGEVLTALNSLTDLDGLGPITYHWERQDAGGNWVDSGATGTTYKLGEADVGHKVRAVAYYTDGHGTVEQVVSGTPTAAVANVNDAPVGGVGVTGVADQGQVLTALDNIADADGVGSVAYHWERQDADGNWVDTGATGATYKLGEADVDHAIRVVARYTDGHGTAEQITGTPTPAIANVNDAPSGEVGLAGPLRLGEVLTASNNITDPDGMGAVTYHWERQDAEGNWVDTGAIGTTYTLGVADIGTEMRAVAYYNDGHGTAEQVTSAPSSTVGILLSDVHVEGTHDQFLIAKNWPTSEMYFQDSSSSSISGNIISDAHFVIFSDGVARYDATGSAETVAHLYQSAFDRAPDIVGLDVWAGQLDGNNMTAKDIADYFVTSSEFLGHHGMLDNAGFVNQLYENVLNRPADADGVSAWLNALDHGSSRGEILLGFAESLENVTNTLSFTGDREYGETFRLYETTFNRTPDSDGLLTFTTYLKQGGTLHDLAQIFLNSAEAAPMYNGVDNKAFVDTLYLNAFDRAPDSGQDYWIGQLELGVSRADVLIGISESLESRIVTASETHDNWVFIGHS